MRTLPPKLQLFGKALLLLSLTGCASYQKYDYYAPSSEGKKSVSAFFSSRDHFQFAPLKGFTTLGPAGMPIIPVSTPGNVEVLELEVHFELNENRSFSILRTPCLQLEDSTLLCAEKFSVSGFAESDTPEPITRKLLDVGSVDLKDKSQRITNLQIFKQASFEFTPAWHWLVLNTTYQFRCNQKCPSAFQFDSSDLLEVSGVSKFSEQMRYIRTTKNEFTPLLNPTN